MGQVVGSEMQGRQGDVFPELSTFCNFSISVKTFRVLPGSLENADRVPFSLILRAQLLCLCFLAEDLAN